MRVLKTFFADPRPSVRPIAALPSPPGLQALKYKQGLNGGEGGEKKLTFAVIPKADVFTFWPTVRGGAEAACKEFGIEMIWRGAKDETSPTDEIKIVKLMIGKKVDGIVLAPQSAEALVGVVEEAVAAGIPVVIIDSGLDSDKQVSFVATDNYQGGIISAELYAEAVEGQGHQKIFILTGQPGAFNLQERSRGFVDGLDQLGVDYEIVTEVPGFDDLSKSVEAVESTLRGDPSINERDGRAAQAPKRRAIVQVSTSHENMPAIAKVSYLRVLYFVSEYFM